MKNGFLIGWGACWILTGLTVGVWSHFSIDTAEWMLVIVGGIFIGGLGLTVE